MRITAMVMVGNAPTKYAAYLVTGRNDYSSANPDYGPVNGKATASWLVNNFGWKHIDTPVEGTIGSGELNTQYGRTAIYLYSTGTNTAMVNDENYTPLKVPTHNMNFSDWVWVVPDDYTTDPTPTPTSTPTPKPTPTPVSDYKVWYVKRGDTMSSIMRSCEGSADWSRINEYANSWASKVVRPGQTVYYGWTHGFGVGLYVGDTIEKSK